uniref:DNA-directed RNA polymerase n=1 Tax=Fopius arisanus TaxID=64838 RepID=A0A0C9RBI4_9HYME
MYRLIKAHRLSVRNTYTGSLNIYTETSDKLCSFCHVHHSKMPRNLTFSQVRHRTSTINTALLPIVKKQKRKPKRYAELLEVTHNLTSNRRAAVRTLNASHLSLLMRQPDVTLDKLHRVKRTNLLKISNAEINTGSNTEGSQNILGLQTPGLIEDSLRMSAENQKSGMTVMDDLETSGISGISDTALMIKDRSLLNSIPDDQAKQDLDDDLEPLKLIPVQKSKKKKPDVSDLERVKQVHEQARRESLVRTLNAYLRVCVSTGMMGRAYHTIMHYRKRSGKIKTAWITDITLFNILLQSYASSGNLQKVKEFLKIIREDGLTPTAKTYAAVFECFGRIPAAKKEQPFLNDIRRMMNRQNITFDEVVHQSKSKRGQYSSVRKAIKLLDPGFEPKPQITEESYDCRLLQRITPDGGKPNCSPIGNSLTLDNINRRYSRQVNHEIVGHVEIKSIEKFDKSKPIVPYYKSLISELEEEWKRTASEAFDRDLKALKSREYQPIPNAMVLYPCLCVLDKEEYVKAILRETWRLADGSETFSPSFSFLCKNLGKHINDKYEILESKNHGYLENLQKVYSRYSKWYVDRPDGANGRTAWQRIAEQVSPELNLELESIRWPVNLQISVGKFLYQIILKDIKLDVSRVRPCSKTKHFLPAFYTLFRHNTQKYLIEEIKPHPILAKIYRDSQPETLKFDTSLVPSECPPRPWSSVQSGGYLLLRTDVVRVPIYAMEQWKRLEVVPKRQLWPSLDCLNQLASIPWTVNTVILDLAIKIFRNGGSERLNVPQPPSVLTPPPLLKRDCSEKERKSIFKARMDLRRQKGEMYSLWCDALYRLSLANHFRNKIFWLPHNMDFRGRVYPVPPHLNHLGSDLARSMLIFALGKPLGPNGLDWLKIHCINLTGFKKRNSINERLRYANEILDEIVDSAERPMDGEMWWAMSDEPWQTLATCIEISNALKSPNPEDYICRFPIHQDGSCNGLQHYAALGRDQSGAENVNLHPSSVPQDVYSSVAGMVEDIRKRDANNGVEVAQVLDGFVKRKVIKQTVMTTVYGVTRFGARLQIARQLKDLDEFPQEFVWSASLYLAQKTFDSLRSMFDSARQIQDWFTDCAKVISTMKGKNMEWVTPLGLPVVQPYSKINPTRTGLKEVAMDTYEKPNATKQKNAFAPNFIHSLDSCHMMLTSLHCEKQGITFVSVHDCYWTHPCTVEIMNTICREQFVALHSEPILEDLSEFFVRHYIDPQQKDRNAKEDLESDLSTRKLKHTLTNLPQKGSFNLKSVLKSTYFFS